jgi:hypothetical protein
MPRMSEDADEVAPRGILLFLESLYHAVIVRDERLIRSLLARSYAMHLPREVREEALAHASLPSSSLRAPIQLLRFRHRMSQLVQHDPVFVDVQLELPLSAPDSGVVRLARSARAAARGDDDEDG